MKASIDDLLEDLLNNPDSVILVPAPDPKFEGQKIRVRECAGPYWLQLLRESESSRVRRYGLTDALLKMKENRYHYQSRYIKLCQKVMSGEIYKESPYYQEEENVK